MSHIFDKKVDINKKIHSNFFEVGYQRLLEESV